MSPNSAGRAEKLGYTNVKIYHEGLPEWTKKNFTVLSAQFLKEAFIDKDIPTVLVDVRPLAAAKKAFIKGAVTLPAADIAANLSKFPPRDKKPPIVIYDQNGGDDAKNAAKSLIAAGYTSVTVLTGGMDSGRRQPSRGDGASRRTSCMYPNCGRARFHRQSRR
jgi:rhodanese-related sulfurtransferase